MGHCIVDNCSSTPYRDVLGDLCMSSPHQPTPSSTFQPSSNDWEHQNSNSYLPNLQNVTGHPLEMLNLMISQTNRQWSNKNECLNRLQNNFYNFECVVNEVPNNPVVLNPAFVDTGTVEKSSTYTKIYSEENKLESVIKSKVIRDIWNPEIPNAESILPPCPNWQLSLSQSRLHEVDTNSNFKRSKPRTVGPIKLRRRASKLSSEYNRGQHQLSLNAEVPEFFPKTPDDLNSNGLLGIPKSARKSKKNRPKLTSSLSDLTESISFHQNHSFENRSVPVLPFVAEPNITAEINSCRAIKNIKVINQQPLLLSQAAQLRHFPQQIDVANCRTDVSSQVQTPSVVYNSSTLALRNVQVPNGHGFDASTKAVVLASQQMFNQNNYSYTQRPEYKPITAPTKPPGFPIYRPIPVYHQNPEFYMLHNNEDSLINSRQYGGGGMDITNLLIMTNDAQHERQQRRLLEHLQSDMNELTLRRSAQPQTCLELMTLPSSNEKQIEVIYTPGAEISTPVSKWLQSGYPTRAQDFGYVSELLGDINIPHESTGDLETDAIRSAQSKIERFSENETMPADIYSNTDTNSEHSQSKNNSIISSNSLSSPVRRTTYKPVYPSILSAPLEPYSSICSTKKRLYSAVLCNNSSSGMSDCNEFSGSLILSSSLFSDTKLDSAEDASEDTVTETLDDPTIDSAFPRLIVESKSTSKETNKKNMSEGSIQKCYDDLEQQAIDQYKESDESLNSKYLELEREALEQYTNSQSSIANKAISSEKNDSKDQTSGTVCFTPPGFAEAGASTGVEIGQSKKKYKKKSKKSNLKNSKSPQTGAPGIGDKIFDINTLNNNVDQEHDVFYLYYAHKNKSYVLRLLTDDVCLSIHIKSFIEDFRAGAFPGSCRIFELLACSKTYDTQYVPLEEYNFVDINCVRENVDTLNKSSVVYFKDAEIGVFLELMCTSVQRFVRRNVRLLVPCQDKIDYLKKNTKNKNSIKYFDKRNVTVKCTATSLTTTKYKNFLQREELKIKPYHSRPVFCQELYQSFDFIDFEKANLIQFIRFEGIRNLIDYVEAVWKRLSCFYNSGLFHEVIPEPLPVILWSPIKFYLGSRTLAEKDLNSIGYRSCENLYGMTINGRELRIPNKNIKHIHFIDNFELKRLVDYELAYFEYTQTYGLSYAEMLKLVHAKYSETSKKFTKHYEIQGFAKYVTKILRPVNVDFEKLLLVNTGCIVDYYRFFEYREREYSQPLSRLYHLTAECLHNNALLIWGFIAKDANICDPWLIRYSGSDVPVYMPQLLTNDRPSDAVSRSYPTHYNAYGTNNTESTPNMPRTRDVLKLSEQDKKELKSSIALKLEREIRVCGLHKEKKDIVKISCSLSELIQEDIIEKLEHTISNKKLVRNKDVKLMIEKSAVAIHKSIINSTFSEIMLDTGEKYRGDIDTDIERREQILANMTGFITNLYSSKLPQGRNVKHGSSSRMGPRCEEDQRKAACRRKKGNTKASGNTYNSHSKARNTRTKSVCGHKCKCLICTSFGYTLPCESKTNNSNHDNYKVSDLSDEANDDNAKSSGTSVSSLSKYKTKERSLRNQHATTEGLHKTHISRRQTSVKTRKISQNTNCCSHSRVDGSPQTYSMDTSSKEANVLKGYVHNFYVEGSDTDTLSDDNISPERTVDDNWMSELVTYASSNDDTLYRKGHVYDPKSQRGSYAGPSCLKNILTSDAPCFENHAESIDDGENYELYGGQHSTVNRTKILDDNNGNSNRAYDINEQPSNSTHESKNMGNNGHQDRQVCEHVDYETHDIDYEMSEDEECEIPEDWYLNMNARDNPNFSNSSVTERSSQSLDIYEYKKRDASCNVM